MATAAIPAYGTLFKIGDGAGTENFTTVAEVTNVGGPKLKTDTKDATSHSSPNGYKEFIATLVDGGEVTVDIQYVPTAVTHNATQGMLRDLDLRNKRNFKIVWPDSGATTWTCTGFVVGFDPKAPVEDKLTAAVTIKITGRPTLV